jgi:disulfide bond formation protein DsbB
MDVSLVIFLYGVLAIVAILTLIWFGLMAVASLVSDGVAESFGRLRVSLAPMALVGAWVVAALAMAGSLYFSEIAHYQPCVLCWYQRIAMYPLVLILGIAVFRRDLSIRLYAIPLAAIGAAISTYHYFLEWFPEIDTGACTVGIPCTQVWFREFGFVSLPLLALLAFLLVITLLAIPPRRPSAIEPEPSGADDSPPTEDDR